MVDNLGEQAYRVLRRSGFDKSDARRVLAGSSEDAVRDIAGDEEMRNFVCWMMESRGPYVSEIFLQRYESGKVLGAQLDDTERSFGSYAIGAPSSFRFNTE